MVLMVVLQGLQRLLHWHWIWLFGRSDSLWRRTGHIFLYGYWLWIWKIWLFNNCFFVVFGAIRLARFNVTTGTYEPSVFIGLPIPTAAVVSAIWTYSYYYYDFLRAYGIIFLILQAILGLLMVSNIRYPSFKKLDFNRSSVLKVLIILIIVFSFLYLYPLESLVILASLYVIYGIIRAIYTLIFSKFKMKT